MARCRRCLRRRVSFDIPEGLVPSEPVANKRYHLFDVSERQDQSHRASIVMFKGSVAACSHECAMVEFRVSVWAPSAKCSNFIPRLKQRLNDDYRIQWKCGLNRNG